MHRIEKLLRQNREWADRVRSERPEFFTTLSSQQHPDFLWIGCSDSRVPATELVDMMPGDIFVHRNVANMVVHTDLNCLSVVEYAVEALRVEHIIVCGHYGCGGVRAALQDTRLGMIDNWLRHVKDVRAAHAEELDAMTDDDARLDRLCELNVMEQVRNVCQITVVDNAWREGRKLAVHGFIYALSDGYLRDLDMSVFDLDGADELSRKLTARPGFAGHG